MDTIIYFDHLDTLLPPSQRLVLNLPLNVLSLMSMREGKPCMVVETQLTNDELTVAYAFLTSYPEYCPYARAIAYFDHGITHAETHIKKIQKHLDTVHGTPQWDTYIRPTRNATSRARPKLAQLGITVASLLEVGYTLIPCHKTNSSH